MRLRQFAAARSFRRGNFRRDTACFIPQSVLAIEHSGGEYGNRCPAGNLRQLGRQVWVTDMEAGQTRLQVALEKTATPTANH